MVLSPPPRGRSRAFRLLLHESIILHSIIISVPALLLNRGAEVWFIIETEREIGTGGSPAAPMLLSRIRGIELRHNDKPEREIGTGGSPAAGV